MQKRWLNKAEMFLIWQRKRKRKHFQMWWAHSDGHTQHLKMKMSRPFTLYWACRLFCLPRNWWICCEHTFYWPFGGHIKLQNWKCVGKRNELEHSPSPVMRIPPNSLAWLVFVFLNFAVTFVPLAMWGGAEHSAQLTTAHSSKFSWWEVESLRVEISRDRASKSAIPLQSSLHLSHETCRGGGGILDQSEA